MTHAPRYALSWLLVVAAALAVSSCRVTDVPLWVATPGVEACPVERIREIAYTDGINEHRHTLDLFLPVGKKDFPVVFMVHGGAWMHGDNRCCGLQSSVGEFLASQGIGAVLPNYRLSPGVKHPAHIRDVARAFAWTHQHIAAYGGRPDQLFLLGHSAGGHLVSLLATDERYLRDEGLQTADVKGVISVCGVYHLPPGSIGVKLGGAADNAFRLDEIAPPRGVGGWDWTRRLALPGIPVNVDLYSWVFGDDPNVRKDASPLTHVRADLPPFLLFSAEHDLPTLPAMAEEFHRALRVKGVEAQLLVIKERNHNSIFFRAVEATDPVAQAVLEFIRSHTPTPPG